uniref:Uncharacterized protein n=1 Tax=Anguilla anguilla TaxID=7936 RepID=A0A0E9PLT0_ANGAN
MPAIVKQGQVIRSLRKYLKYPSSQSKTGPDSDL